MKEERDFWIEFRALLIQMTCLIERKKLEQNVTTADLREAGRKALCDKENN